MNNLPLSQGFCTSLDDSAYNRHPGYANGVCFAARTISEKQEPLEEAKETLRCETIMQAKIIKTEPEYDQALARIDKLMDACPETPEGDELELLVTLVELYEAQECIIIDELTNLLNECLETANQESSFKVISFDKDKMKLTVEFDVAYIEEDDYIGFQGY